MYRLRRRVDRKKTMRSGPTWALYMSGLQVIGDKILQKTGTLSSHGDLGTAASVNGTAQRCVNEASRHAMKSQ